MKRNILLLIGGAVVLWILILSVQFQRWLLWGSKARSETKEATLTTILLLDKTKRDNETNRCFIPPVLSVWESVHAIIPLLLSNQTVSIDFKEALLDHAILSTLAKEKLSFQEWIENRRRVIEVMRIQRPELLTNKLVRLIENEMEPTSQENFSQGYSTNCDTAKYNLLFSFFTNSLSVHVFELEHKFVAEYDIQVFSSQMMRAKRLPE